MDYNALHALAKSKRWSDLEREWLAVIEQAIADPAPLLQVIDAVVAAEQGDLAATMAWAWLSVMKETHTAAEALQLGRGLLLRLPDGNELREEILSLYRQTHGDRRDLEAWIDRSGLKSGKSVRRAINYLTNALRLGVGVCLIHRAADEAAEITAFDAAADSITIRTPRRTATHDIARLVEEYEVATEDDFRVLSQLWPDRLAELMEHDPTALAIGILRCHGNRIDRDELKLLLVPRHLTPEKWSDWWAKVRDGVKRSPHLRIEGRSPMCLIYNPISRTLEEEEWAAFSKATTPREWLDVLEGYLRDTRQQKHEPDTAFLNRVQDVLVRQIERFSKHQEPAHAFATALVIERVAADGLPVSTDAHGMALRMLQDAADPVAVVASVGDVRPWSLAIRCVEQAFPERWPELLAELILYAPAGQCDVLAKKTEGAGRGNLLPVIVERATADPGRFTDALMWVWKGPGVETPLPIPPRPEMLSIILGLVGPARTSDGKVTDQTTNEMRAKVRTGLISKAFAGFKECLEGMDPAMAQAIRRQIERAVGLGPRVQEGMLDVLRAKFPKLYVKAKVEVWDDETVLYFSEAGLKIKEAEQHEIVNVKMRENAKAIGEAASHGDLSENSEFKFALEERDLLRARVAQLNSELSLARTIDPHDIPTDHVSIGQRLTLIPIAGGAPAEMTIMGINDTDLARRVYSYKTPLARQVLGRRVGDEVTLSFEDKEAQYRLERIDSAVHYPKLNA